VRIPKWRGVVAAAAAVLGAASAAPAKEEIGLSRLFPESVSTYGHSIDELYSVIYWIVAATFVLTQVVLVWFVLRYRARPGGKAVYTHGNHRLEMIWTLTPGAILFWLALYQTGTWKTVKIDKPPPKDGLVVQVLAKQFEWNLRYAGPDGKFGTEDDVTTINWLHVPVDTNVTVLLRSQDVLHSFFLPNMRLKQDTVPGLTISQWFRVLPGKTTEEERARRKARGDANAEKFEYEIACAELCGILHTQMRGFVRVHSREDFWKWIDGAYVNDVRPYGTDPKSPINAYWPKDQNGVEDPWLRDGWPPELKAKWPEKGP
jgi:cytochrome c oxidase subunit 2